MLPNFGRNALLDDPGRHVMVKFFAFAKWMPQIRQRAERRLKNIKSWINDTFMITRLMALYRRNHRSKNVIGAAVSRKKHFDTRARGLDRFDEDEFVLVRNDHRRSCPIVSCREKSRHPAMLS